MARFLKRLAGNYDEVKLMMHVHAEKLKCNTKDAYKLIYLEFKRGDKIEKSEKLGEIPTGDSEVVLGKSFSKLSQFYREQKVTPDKY